MKISVFGTGYVGLVTGVCFAEMGNEVIGADIDANKIAQLKEGKSPIYEPGLDGLLASSIKSKRIVFTTDIKKAIEDSELLFIAVGTPSDIDGSADLQYVLQVAEEIGKHMNSYKVVINKSTVPVGTQKKVKEAIQKVLTARKSNFEFDVVSNPEFLREGCAIEDCLKPNRVVIGLESGKAAQILRRLYEPFLKSGNPLIVMDPLSSEMTKYAANSMLATRISLMNEFSMVCEKVGADIEQVRRGIGTDSRIGPQFIFAGIGYGGSCFPKDVKALIKTGQQFDSEMKILKSVEDINAIQRKNYFNKLKKNIGGSFKGVHIGVWGIAFKPGTDDIREAPAIDLIEWLLKEGAFVTAYDPVAEERSKEYFKNTPQLKFVEDQYDCCNEASALCIVTEWKSFREPNFDKIKSLMKTPKIFDGRNIYNPKVMKEVQVEYHSIGRPSIYT